MKRGMEFTSEAQNLGPEFYSLMDHLFKKKIIWMQTDKFDLMNLVSWVFT